MPTSYFLHSHVRNLTPLLPVYNPTSYLAEASRLALLYSIPFCFTSGGIQRGVVGRQGAINGGSSLLRTGYVVETRVDDFGCWKKGIGK